MNKENLHLIGLIASKENKAFCVDIEKYPKFEEVVREFCGGEVTISDKAETDYDIVVIGKHDPNKVVLIQANSKPREWSWGKFFSVINATRFIPLNNTNGAPFYKEIDI